MRKQFLLLLSLMLQSLLYSQNSNNITGRIFDKLTNEPLQGATVFNKKDSSFTQTDNSGYFSLRYTPSGKADLVISFMGYETAEISIDVSVTGVKAVNVGLLRYIPTGEELVISASKKTEKIINAPASVHVIDQKTLQKFSGSNVFELFSKVQGIEFARIGVDYIAINARGFNRPGNNRFFQMVDGRNVMSAVSIGVPLYHLASWNKDDVDKIEVLLGPQAALYGPNVLNGLVYISTKDPRKYQGTDVSISAGNQSQFSTRFRHASVINSKWAFKLTGEYAVGREFEFYDSVYAGNNGDFGPRVAIPERNVDFDFKHIRAEAYVYYKPGSKTDVIISGGGSENDFLGVNNNGRNQFRGVRTAFLQARLSHPNYFITIYNNWGNIGSTYAITPYTRDYHNRSHSLLPPSNPRGRLSPEDAEKNALRYGNRFKEVNQRLNGEAQYNYSFNNGIYLVAGLAYQQDKPYSYGYTMVDKYQRIVVTQYGAVVQLEKSFQKGFRFSGSLRYDHHSNYGDMISPKLAMIKNVGSGNFRITWGKAFAVPSVFVQYANIAGTTFGNGPGIRYVANDSPIDQVVTTTPLKPEEINTWETGYKGRIAANMFVDMSMYYGHTRNFLSTAQPVGGRILSVGDIPVEPLIPGTVDTSTGILRRGLFNTYFNYGEVRAYGLDAGWYYNLGQHFDFSVKYSWFGSDISKDNMKNDANGDSSIMADEKSYNAARNRLIVQMGILQLFRKKLDIGISARYTEEYDFYSGNQIGTREGAGSRGMVGPYPKNFDWGPLGGYTVIDLNSSYKMNHMMLLNLNISNLFNVPQREFVGSPPVGRLIMLELKLHVPSKAKKTDSSR